MDVGLEHMRVDHPLDGGITNGVPNREIRRYFFGIAEISPIWGIFSGYVATAVLGVGCRPTILVSQISTLININSYNIMTCVRLTILALLASM